MVRFMVALSECYTLCKRGKTHLYNVFTPKRIHFSIPLSSRLKIDGINCFYNRNFDGLAFHILGIQKRKAPFLVFTAETTIHAPFPVLTFH